MESYKLLKKLSNSSPTTTPSYGIKNTDEGKTVNAMKSTSLNHFIVFFTSFSGHRPAQREYARTGLIGPMQGTSPTQSHNP